MKCKLYSLFYLLIKRKKFGLKLVLPQDLFLAYIVFTNIADFIFFIDIVSRRNFIFPNGVGSITNPQKSQAYANFLLIKKWIC